MSRWRVRGQVNVDESPMSLNDAYAREVRWAQGFRINNDSRLVLLGMRRLLSQKILTESEMRTAAFVIGCRLGAMDSYETFDDGLLQAKEVPLAFAYALPSMPLACASICHSLRGLTYTVTGEWDVGIQAFGQATELIASTASRMVITGCWDSPSKTAGDHSKSCRLVLIVIEEDVARQGSAPVLEDADIGGFNGLDTTGTLKRYLADRGYAFTEDPCNA